MSRTFRDFVLVMAETKGPTMHHFATNPHASWGWYARERHGTGFRRLHEAKDDAERVLGPVDWKGKDGNRVRGEYGPEMTPHDYITRKIQ